MVSNDEYIIHGPEPDTPIQKISFGKMIFDHLLSSKLPIEIMKDAFTGETVTASKLLYDSCNLAQALRTTGYGSNAVIAIISENSLHFFTPLFASLFNTSIACLLNPSSTPFELKHCLNITKPKLVFCSHKCSQKLVELEKDLKCIEKIIIIDQEKPRNDSIISIDDFVEKSLNGRFIQPYNFEPDTFDPVTTPAFVLYSSGTTGLPKGVMLSHYNFVVCHSMPWSTDFDPSNPQSSIGLAPFYHSMGLNSAIAAFLSNTRLLVMNQFDEDVFLKLIQDYKIQMLKVPPPLLVLLVKSPKVKKYDLSSLKFVATGAASVRKHMQEEVMKRFNLISTPQGYGLTETTLGVILLPPGDIRPESCGVVVYLTSCIVRDPISKKSLGPNKPGELCFKGPLIMMGYYNDEKATREAFTEDGWLRSGDIGYYDKEGYFYIVDRLKELIKYKGFQVAPAELEGILLSHPKIADAAVIGRPDERSGELPTAFIVKKETADLTEKEVQDYVAGLVSPQKRLSGGVIFISQIPKNPAGKILRNELRKVLETQNTHRSKL